MNKFDEIFESKEPEKFGEELFIDIRCEQCNMAADQVFYNKATKKVKTVCDVGHEAILDIDLSWMSG